MPPLNMLIKPASGSCNLRCAYCFYYDEMENREQASYGRMTPETQELLVRRAFEYAEGSVMFSFQGGEPTLMGLPFIVGCSSCSCGITRAISLFKTRFRPTGR